MKTLLQLGADPMLRDDLGRLPMDLIPRSFNSIEHEEDRRREVLHRLREILAALERRAGASAPPRGPACPPACPPAAPVRAEPPKHPPHGEDDPSQASAMLEMPEYRTDAFRMFRFKVVMCCRPEAHSWRECPYVHVGETAKRRDPRVFKYSGAPCPDFRRGSCRNGDGCRYAHGVFESWLHPSKYRTKMCKEGEACTRRVCFFAHTAEELREDAAAEASSGESSPRRAASPAAEPPPPPSPEAEGWAVPPAWDLPPELVRHMSSGASSPAASIWSRSASPSPFDGIVR